MPPIQGAKETPFRALFLLAHPAGNLGDNVCPISLSPQVTVMSTSPVSSTSPAELHSILLWQSLLWFFAPQSNKLQDVTQAGQVSQLYMTRGGSRSQVLDTRA